MNRVFCRSTAAIVLSLVLCSLLGLAELLPRPLPHSRAVRAIGGCSSGLCSDQQNGLCAYVSDGCSGYSNCVSNDDGLDICTPASFCGGGGCGGKYNGGTCQ